MDKNKILVAVPSNDGETIFRKMLGMAKYFYIYQIDKSGQDFSFIEIRENPYSKTQQHLKTFDVYKLISDCRIILASYIGKKGSERLKNKGVELLYDTGSIQSALLKIRERG